MIITIFKYGFRKNDKERGASFESVRNLMRSKFQITVTEYKEKGLLWIPQRNHLGLKYLFFNAIIW